MGITFIDREWHQAFESASDIARKEALIVVPFLRRSVLEGLLGPNPAAVKVVTRFNLDDFRSGVSDIRALEFLLDVGAEVKGVKHLHAKVYVFGGSLALVTSANLTNAALFRNAEFGVQSDERAFVQATASYFDQLWQLSGPRLTRRVLARWRRRLAHAPRGSSQPGLGDHGVDLGFPTDEQSAGTRRPPRFFVKFFGTSRDRAGMNLTVHEEIGRSASHWALSYPASKRPRQIQDGDVVFIARLVAPQDIIVYGRAYGLAYKRGRDDASQRDIRVRPWKHDWPHYIRVQSPEFVDGTLSDCVSLYKLMADLGPETFATSWARTLAGQSGINPRDVYQRQAGVELTPQAAAELGARLAEAFDKHGRLTESDLEDLDWPDIAL